MLDGYLGITGYTSNPRGRMMCVLVFYADEGDGVQAKEINF